MKLPKLLSTTVFAAALLASGTFTSCYRESTPPEPRLDVDKISEQVRQAIDNEIALVELSDTISFQSTTDSATVAASKRPVSINNLKVIVDNDEYSLAVEQYNKRMREGHKFTLSILFLLLPMLIVLAVTVGLFIYVFRKTTERNRLIQQAIENNYQLPDSFYENNNLFNFKKGGTGKDVNGNTPPPTHRDQKLFNKGITYICIGLAIFIFFLTVSAEEAAALALIPVFIGVAKLITYYHN